MGFRRRTSSSTTLINDTDDSNERHSLAKQLEHVDNPRELRAFILDLTSLIKTQVNNSNNLVGKLMSENSDLAGQVSDLQKENDACKELMRYKNAWRLSATDESVDGNNVCSEDEVIQKVCEIKERNARLEKEIMTVTQRRIAIQNDMDLLEGAYGVLKEQFRASMTQASELEVENYQLRQQLAALTVSS
ncbi:hypothetical protein H4R35_007192, partial [Dimargaris xerosporica]